MNPHDHRLLGVIADGGAPDIEEQAVLASAKRRVVAEAGQCTVVLEHRGIMIGEFAFLRAACAECVGVPGCVPGLRGLWSRPAPDTRGSCGVGDLEKHQLGCEVTELDSLDDTGVRVDLRSGRNGICRGLGRASRRRRTGGKHYSGDDGSCSHQTISTFRAPRAKAKTIGTFLARVMLCSACARHPSGRQTRARNCRTCSRTPTRRILDLSELWKAYQGFHEQPEPLMGAVVMVLMDPASSLQRA